MPKKSYVLNIPTQNPAYDKVWVCCPSCLNDYVLGDGVFVEVVIKGTKRNIKFCPDCAMNQPLNVLASRVENVIAQYHLENEVYVDEEEELKGS